MLFQAKNNLYL